VQEGSTLRISVTTDQELASSRQRVLWLSTLAFTLLFNVWLMLGVLGIPIRQELGLSDAQLEWLIASAILSGAVLRLHFGIWAEAYGDRGTPCSTAQEPGTQLSGV
jgi:NNP family nitrate/nitrite transporter-like MFS transporter